MWVVHGWRAIGAYLACGKLTGAGLQLLAVKHLDSPDSQGVPEAEDDGYRRRFDRSRRAPVHPKGIAWGPTPSKVQEEWRGGLSHSALDEVNRRTHRKKGCSKGQSSHFSAVLRCVTAATVRFLSHRGAVQEEDIVVGVLDGLGAPSLH